MHASNLLSWVSEALSEIFQVHEFLGAFLTTFLKPPPPLYMKQVPHTQLFCVLKFMKCDYILGYILAIQDDTLAFQVYVLAI